MAEDSYALMPMVIEETSGGYFSLSIIDQMFQRRQIQCVGEVDEKMANSLCLQLRSLAAREPGEEITIVINSPGGSVSDGLAIIDVMHAIGCPIRTVCQGLAASMGALIFVSGTKGRRQVLPHSRVMIHDPLAQRISGNALSVKAKSDDLMRTREISAQILSEATGKTVEEVYAATAQDTFFEAQAAVEWGLADEVITEF